MNENDLNNLLINIACPYGGHRKGCSLDELKDLDVEDKMELIKKMEDDEKIKKWQKHLECFMNSMIR